jgi:hypothetical protein
MSWLADVCHLTVTSRGRERERERVSKISPASFSYKVEGSTLMAPSPPKGPVSKYHHLGVSGSAYEFGGAQFILSSCLFLRVPKELPPPR